MSQPNEVTGTRMSVRLEMCARYHHFDGFSEGAEVECLGEGRYRLLDVLGLLPLQYRDTFEAIGCADSTPQKPALQVVRRVEKSGQRKLSHLLGRDGVQSPRWKSVLGRVEALGGGSAVMFGGILLISLPNSVRPPDVGLPS
jgi:hypothetical protein